MHLLSDCQFTLWDWDWALSGGRGTQTETLLAGADGVTCRILTSDVVFQCGDGVGSPLKWEDPHAEAIGGYFSAETKTEGLLRFQTKWEVSCYFQNVQKVMFTVSASKCLKMFLSCGLGPSVPNSPPTVQNSLDTAAAIVLLTFQNNNFNN